MACPVAAAVHPLACLAVVAVRREVAFFFLLAFASSQAAREQRLASSQAACEGRQRGEQSDVSQRALTDVALPLLAGRHAGEERRTGPQRPGTAARTRVVVSSTCFKRCQRVQPLNDHLTD